MAGEFDYSDDENEKTSKYNSAFTQIYRLDIEWKFCNQLSTKGKLIDWNWHLDVIWRELAGDLSKEDERIKEFKSIDNRRKLLNDKLAINKNNFLKFNKDMYDLLIEKELFLRRLQNALGKGTAFEENDDDYMDG